ncbi:MAG: hypothetical protein KatS3mg011_1565 [Acidimicrobiia bacterium]|nr:MAG: hypothetical protein KatS3mg011_1565 [Acidimicrobiia bacterium]
MTWGRPPTPVNRALYRYLAELAVPDDPITARLAEETRRVLPDQSSMQVGIDQAKLLYLLVRLVRARTVVEVGTFTGMSSLWMARALEPGGRVICFDRSDEWTSIARRYWEEAGVADRIELRIGQAAEQLGILPAEPHVDLAFIDADKYNYPTYLELLAPRLRSGGLLLADNVLWAGRIIDRFDEGRRRPRLEGVQPQGRRPPRPRVGDPHRRRRADPRGQTVRLTIRTRSRPRRSALWPIRAPLRWSPAAG